MSVDLPQMVSARFSAHLLRDLRQLAEKQHQTVSDLLRQGAAELIERANNNGIYDWADDPYMTAKETMRRFNALNPQPTTGPPGEQR